MTQYIVMNRQGYGAASPEKFCEDLFKQCTGDAESNPFIVFTRINPVRFWMHPQTGVESEKRELEKKEFVVIQYCFIEKKGDLATLENILRETQQKKEIDGNTSEPADKDWYGNVMYIGPDRAAALNFANRMATQYVDIAAHPRKNL